MKLILKSLYVLVITIFMTVIGYYDYLYNSTFYHSLIILGLLIISYCTYTVNKTVNELLRIHKKWLGI